MKLQIITAISQPVQIPLTFTCVLDGSICLSAINYPTTSGLQYNTGSGWLKYNINKVLNTVIGDKIKFRNTNNKFSTNTSYFKFVMVGKFNCSGNIMSLLNYRYDCPSCCFQYLFANCSSLLTTPELPATKIADSCYNSMFYNCKSLSAASELPATTLADYCYSNMFSGCTSLTTAPELPATTLAVDCYSNMFKGYTSLNTTPELPATNLASYCYSNMFKGCTSLNTTPELPATTLAGKCYLYMFYGCTSLSAAPDLPAINLDIYCYQYMFLGCSKIKLLNVCFTKWNSNSYLNTYNWVNFSNEGIFRKPIELSSAFGNSYIPNNDWVIYNHLKFTCVESGSICLSAIGNPVISGLQYNIGNNWLKYNINTILNINKNQYILFRNISNTLSIDLNNYVQFIMTGKFNCIGDILNLLYNKNCDSYCFYKLFKNCSSLLTMPNFVTTLLSAFCYANMFENCTNLSAISNLPASSLVNSCYINMFKGCTNLSSFVELPGVILADSCYKNMFTDCIKLKQVSLAAVTLVDKCCLNMFENCISLSNINTQFKLWNSLYTLNWVKNISPSGIFIKLNDLSDIRGNSYIPENWLSNMDLTFTCLSQTGGYVYLSGINTLSYDLQYKTDLQWYHYTLNLGINVKYNKTIKFRHLYNGFSSNYSEYFQFLLTGIFNCSGTIMSLLNYSNKCYSYCFYNLFNNCTSLKTAPELPATILADHCYYYMFNKCKGLKNLPELPATTLVESCYSNMFSECTSLTSVQILPATNLARWCYSHMFSGCTSLTTAPELPISSLEYGCYLGMFEGCTALSTAPLLPASSLTNYCYQSMFNECTNLKSISTYFTSWTKYSSYTSSWLNEVATYGNFYGKAGDTTRSVNTIPSNWTYHAI